MYFSYKIKIYNYKKYIIIKIKKYIINNNKTIIKNLPPSLGNVVNCTNYYWNYKINHYFFLI